MKKQSSSISIAESKRIRAALQGWYEINQRDLPWRDTRDPYAIWVSEIMLQQTQVAAVIPYFQKFMQRFPTVFALAHASEQDVLKYWEGLGYYRRARHLYQAACIIVQQHSGIIPAQKEELSSLPGFGRYTVNAVLSQAYDQRLPIVDANVARVLCRLFAWKKNLQSKETQTWLWSMAEALLPEDQVGDFNQAWMELGQTICTTGKPQCLLCPLKSLCRGRHLADKLPVRNAQPVVSNQYERAIIVLKGKRILLAHRPAHASRWANMWEFPTCSMSKPDTHLRTVNQQCRQLTGYGVSRPTKLCSLQYGITRFRVTLDIVQARHQSGKAHQKHYQQLKWITLDQLQDFPLSVPQRRIAKRLLSKE